MSSCLALCRTMPVPRSSGLFVRDCIRGVSRWTRPHRSPLSSTRYSTCMVLMRRTESNTRQTCQFRASRQLSEASADFSISHRRHVTSRSGTFEGDNRVLTRSIKPKDDTIGEAIEVTINNPQKLNSLDSALLIALADTVDTASKSPSTRCIVIRGGHDPTSTKTPSFSAGASLKEMSTLQTPQEAEAFITRISDLCKAITDSPVPVIAAIHGHCYGAGLEIAASCDVRYATMSSQFAMPEVKVGIPSVVQARLLVDIMGWAHARHLMLFGRTINAGEAYRQGLINDVFEDVKNLDERVMQDVQSAFEFRLTAVKAQKELMREWQRLDVDGGIQAGIPAFREMWKDGGKEPRMHMQKALDRLKSKSSKN